MKRSLLLSVCAATVVAMSFGHAKADNLQLTLDLLNAAQGDAASGGTWSLYARVVDTAGVDGSTGIAGLRALIDNINATGITFASGINANGAANFQALSNDPEGTVEVVYGQDLSQATTAGIGVAFATPNLDQLIATGTWPAGAARPVFGNDNGGSGPVLLSDGGFLTGAAAVAANAIPTQVVTLADVNGSNNVTLTDIQPFLDVLNAVTPYNPAADVNQSGTVTLTDIQPFLNVLNTGVPISASIGAVPEPASISLAMLSGIALIALRRNR